MALTFLKLQNWIIQTRKSRKGIHNKIDYFKNDNNEDYYNLVYKKALKAANEVVRYYEEKGEVSSKDKVTVTIK